MGPPLISLICSHWQLIIKNHESIRQNYARSIELHKNLPVGISLPLIPNPHPPLSTHMADATAHPMALPSEKRSGGVEDIVWGGHGTKKASLMSSTSPWIDPAASLVNACHGGVRVTGSTVEWTCQSRRWWRSEWWSPRPWRACLSASSPNAFYTGIALFRYQECEEKEIKGFHYYYKFATAFSMKTFSAPTKTFWWKCWKHQNGLFKFSLIYENVFSKYFQEN